MNFITVSQKSNRADGGEADKGSDKMSASAILQYSAVITKMRAMYTGILKRSDYEKLMSMTRVGDVVRRLKESRGYGTALEDVSDTSVHRNILESAFDNALIEDANKLKHMLGNDGKRMLTVLMSRIEIMMLKRILRAIYTGIPAPSRAFYRLYAPKTYSSNKHLDPYKCIRAKDFHQLIDVLRGSGYDKVLEPYVMGEITSTFDMEEALDEYYFKVVLESAEKYLTKEDYNITKNFFGTEADIQNIIWIYRYKKYYDFTEEEILGHILPDRRKLRKEQIRSLSAAGVDDFQSAVSETRYRWLFAGDDVQWESEAADYLCKMYMSQIRHNKYSFAAIVAYLFLKEIDIQNIITIVEGVRYGMEPQQIEQYLILGDHNGH